MGEAHTLVKGVLLLLALGSATGSTMEFVKQTPRAARLLRLLLVVLLVAATNEAAELAEQLVSTARLLLGRVILLLPRGLVGELVEEIHGVSGGVREDVVCRSLFVYRGSSSIDNDVRFRSPSYIRSYMRDIVRAGWGGVCWEHPGRGAQLGWQEASKTRTLRTRRRPIACRGMFELLAWGDAMQVLR